MIYLAGNDVIEIHGAGLFALVVIAIVLAVAVCVIGVS